MEYLNSLCKTNPDIDATTIDDFTLISPKIRNEIQFITKLTQSKCNIQKEKNTERLK